MSSAMTYRPIRMPAGPLAAPRMVPSWHPRFAESALECSRLSAWETEGGALGLESGLFRKLALAQRLRETSRAQFLTVPRPSWERRRAFRQGPQGSR
jgi:hypothetical protein